MVLSLEFGPTDHVLEWASEIVARHEDKRVIVVTHSYLHHDDTRVGEGDPDHPREQDKASRDGNDGEEMWDKLVKLHPNIFLVLSGHDLDQDIDRLKKWGVTGKLTSTGVGGNEVHQILANYQQWRARGGDGLLRLLKFVPEESTIEVLTYTPSLHEYLTDPDNGFALDYDMSPEDGSEHAPDTRSFAGGSSEEQAWVRQFGTPNGDGANDVAVHAGGAVYVAGYTWGNLGSPRGNGQRDAYLRKYDAGGNEAWTRQFGTAGIDTAWGVAVASDGAVYVVGSAGQTSDESTIPGDFDAFISKYDGQGKVIWTDRFGAARSEDEARGVAIDPFGDVYVAGRLDLPSAAAFVRKYDADGGLLWERVFAPEDVYTGVLAVSADGKGNVYLAGDTSTTLSDQTRIGQGREASDAFVRKYDANGNELWTRQFGTENTDRALGLTVDHAGDVYVVGDSTTPLPGQVPGRESTVTVNKLASSGDYIWTLRLGTNGVDTAWDIAIDGAGRVYVVGQTSGALQNQTHAGHEDAFVASYDSEDGVLAVRQLGTELTDVAYGVDVAENGDLYIVGQTWASLPHETGLGRLPDAFVMRMSVEP